MQESDWHSGFDVAKFELRFSVSGILFSFIPAVLHAEFCDGRTGEPKSKKNEMEDATGMTIELLREQLLSERSVSNAAMLRVDELAKRVMKLEEQLKFVTIRRKKAEKATVELLKILENDGTTDFSEAFNLSCEQEGVLCDSKNGRTSTKEEKTHDKSRRRKDTEEFSCSELEYSSSTDGNLSWKSYGDSPYSFEIKYINDDRRRRRRFASSVGALSKQCLRKSCCINKRNERRNTQISHRLGIYVARSAVDTVKDESSLIHARENEVASHLGGVPHCFNDRPQISRKVLENEKVSLGAPLAGSSQNQREVTNAGLYVNGSNGHKDMERAREQQDQLKSRYEVMENTQRERERKFKDNVNCILDSYDSRNRYDITEERGHIRSEATDPIDTIVFNDQGGKPEAAHACCQEGTIAKTQPDGFPLSTHADIGCLQDQQNSSMLANESSINFPKFSFPGQENIEANTKLENILLHQPSRASPRNYSAQVSSRSSESFYTVESSGSRNDLQASMVQETTNGLGSVLEALKKAKLSLDHDLKKLFVSGEGGLIKSSTEHPANAIKTGNAVEAPVRNSGVFIAPTGSKIEVTNPQSNFLGSFPGLNFTRNNPDMRDGGASGDQYFNSPYLETMPRISPVRPISDPYLNTALSLPDFNRYSYPSHTALMPRTPSNDGLLIPYSSKGPLTSAEDQNTFHNNQSMGSNMHRR